MTIFLRRLQTKHKKKIRAITGYSARVRRGHYGRGKRVQTGTVSSAITAVGQTITLEYGVNPTKIPGTDKFHPRISQTLDGMRKEDPPTSKKLPVEVDVPEEVAKLGASPDATEHTRAVRDLSLITFLLRVGEYTVKGTRNESK